MITFDFSGNEIQSLFDVYFEYIEIKGLFLTYQKNIYDYDLQCDELDQPFYTKIDPLISVYSVYYMPSNANFSENFSILGSRYDVGTQRILMGPHFADNPLNFYDTLKINRSQIGKAITSIQNSLLQRPSKGRIGPSILESGPKFS